MASQMEALARQFRREGHEDIALGISSWAVIARQRGVESFKVPVIPEDAEKFSLEIGEETADQYLELLNDAGVQFSFGSESLLKKSLPITPQKLKKVDLVKLKVRDLGFTNDVTGNEIFERAQEKGFQLVPAEVVPAQRLADVRQRKDDLYSIGMPILGDDGYERVFTMENNSGSLWLTYRLTNTYSYSPKEKFIFALGKSSV